MGASEGKEQKSEDKSEKPASRLLERLRRLYHRVNKASGGSLGVIRHASTNFTLMRGPEAAAGLSYYALFSIFPVLIAVISIGSNFVSIDVVKERILQALHELIPVSADFINNLVSGVLEQRGTVTIIALITLIWSASNVFDKLIRNVNRAFPHGQKAGFLQNRAMAVVMVLVLILLFVGSLLISSIKGFFDLDKILIGGVGFTQTKLYAWARFLLPILIKFLFFWAVYSWVPLHAEVLFQAKLIGALVAAALWELATRVLGWAISAGFANYEVVYGSLSSIIYLMTWLYLTGFIIFWGAHLTHAINYQMMHDKEDKQQKLNQSMESGND
jgi:membrane protein